MTKVVFATVLLLAFVAKAVASSADCDAISDSTKRSFCRAIANGNAADCSAIADQQQWRACIAAVSGRSADCESIINQTSRQLCRSFSR